MKVFKIINHIYKGHNQRLSLLDVFYPEKVEQCPIVIFAHGFKGFKDWGIWNSFFEKLSSEGFVVVKFNFSHNGGNVQNPIDFPDLEAFSANTYSKELYDLEKVIDLVEHRTIPEIQHADTSKIYLIGHSRGGGISILTSAKDSRIKRLVTWASVSDFFERLPNSIVLEEWKDTGTHFIQNTRTHQMMPMKYSFVEDLLGNKNNLDIKAAATTLTIPWKIIHGTDDPVVLPSEAETLHQLSGTSELDMIEEANHVFGGSHPFHHEELPESVNDLLNSTLDFLKR